MSMLDRLFGREEDHEEFVRNATLSSDAPLNDEEIITIDPDKPFPKEKPRPPVIFENG